MSLAVRWQSCTRVPVSKSRGTKGTEQCWKKQFPRATPFPPLRSSDATYEYINYNVLPRDPCESLRFPVSPGARPDCQSRLWGKSGATDLRRYAGVMYPPRWLLKLSRNLEDLQRGTSRRRAHARACVRSHGTSMRHIFVVPGVFAVLPLPSFSFQEHMCDPCAAGHTSYT